MKRARSPPTETSSSSGSSSSDSTSDSSSSSSESSKKKPVKKRVGNYVPQTHLPRKKVKLRALDRSEAVLNAPQELFEPAGGPPREGRNPLQTELAPLYFTVDLVTNNTTHDLPPLSRKSVVPVGKKDGPAKPPVQYLSTGIPFINTLSWHPGKFKLKKRIFRVLLVGGTRIPRTYTWAFHGKVQPTWVADEPEVNKVEVNRFSRILQLWRVAVPTGPGAPEQDFSTDEDGDVKGPSTVELTLPDEPDWGVTDVQWYGHDDESVQAMMTPEGFHHCSPVDGRLGYIAVTGTKGHLAIYRIPIFGETPQHFILDPIAVLHMPYAILTSVSWQLRNGVVNLYVGMTTGDVGLVHLLRIDGTPQLLLSKHLRNAALGVIRQISVFNAWYGKTTLGIDVGSSDSAADQADTAPPVLWDIPTAPLKLPIRGNYPALPGIHDRDLLVTNGIGERGISCWDTDLIETTTGHYGQLHVKSKFAVSRLHTIPFSTVLVGMEDGTLIVQPPITTWHLNDPPPGTKSSASNLGGLSLPAWNLRTSLEVHNAITGISHVSCNRRKPDKDLRNNIRAEGKRPPKIDYLIGVGTASGLFSVLRTPKRLLMVDQGARKCKICRSEGVKSSWMIASCNCMPNNSLMSSVEDTAVAIVNAVEWALPKDITDQPKVRVSLTPYPTVGAENEHRNITSRVGNMMRSHNHLVDMAAGDKRAHLYAMSAQGGLVTVIPL